jgi:hypothetical protein
MLYTVEFLDWNETYLVETSDPAEAIELATIVMRKEAGSHKVVESVRRSDLRLVKKPVGYKAKK